MTYTRGDNGPGVGRGSYLFDWSVKWQEILRGCARDGSEADSLYIYAADAQINFPYAENPEIE